ncbi:ABC transporter substrate-binding protein [Streptomyces verrucosisporus]|uniref:ABC transporter substrate-binding protein n=1 Tax=Streptomyces verrucosisporus TaxID=1695161 RepID=UPI0019D292D9|nr:ABC transporter substrate-binding protein [Streptomyces verrucosisporus]MBN3928573.1 ABC transporter substrate-binding protein [Streptomyces verrucosisporus]
MTRRTAAALTGCLIAAALTTGCGGSSAEAEERGYRLVEDGKLTFAMSGQYRPFNYFEDDGELAGFDVELGNELAERLDLEPNPVTGPFNSLVAGLKAKRYDLIVGSMSPTEERKKQVDFTGEYYVSGAQLFVEDDSAVASADDLKDAKVGVVLGTTFEEYAQKQPGVAEVKTYNSDNEMLTELSNGRLDAAITTKLLGLYQIKQAGIDVKPTGEVLFPDPAAIASQKGNPELTAEVDKALDEIRDDGTYARLSEKWFGTDISQDTRS